MGPRVQLRTNRQQPRSYREQSFDDDMSDESFTQTDNIDTDDDDDSSSSRQPSPQPRATRERPSTRNRGQAKVSYKEDSDHEPEASQQARSNTSDLASRKRTRTAKAASRPLTSRKKQKVRKGFTKRRPNTKSSTPKPIEISPPIVSDGVIPNWISLPYEVLYQIFFDAKLSMMAESPYSNTPATWLVGVARLNKAFLEPALAALYYSPPLTSGSQAFKLLDLLSSDQRNEHIISYNTKVKSLDVELESCLTHSVPGRGIFRLESLIPYVPQLQRVNLWNDQDLPKYGSARQNFRPYPVKDTLKTLSLHKISVTSWQWRGRYIPPKPSARKTDEARLISADMNIDRQKLQQVKFTNFDANFFFGSEYDIPLPIIPSFCSTLPLLRDLTFQECGVAPGSLELLPTNLEKLTLIDCDSLVSPYLEQFLLSHGSSLKEVALRHNRNLNLSFLVSLKVACPKLQVLSIDLTYYSTLQSTTETEPGYDYLILANETPSWPSTLQDLELNHLRNWSSEAAENFFKSLANSASALPDLRKLNLTAHVNIGWKERAEFRSTWVSTLRRIFLRKSTPPNPHLMSLKAFRLWKEGKVPQVVVGIKERPLADSDDSDAPLLSRGRTNPTHGKQLPTPQPSEDLNNSRRLRSRRIAVDSSEESEPPIAVSSRRNNVMKLLENRAQGMCEVVHISIDNLRPRENQLNESNFLDSELSGDEDYVEGQDATDEGEGAGYAW